MSKITGLTPREDYRLEVRLENGSSVTLNLESRLETIRCGQHSDKELFKRAVTDRYETSAKIADQLNAASGTPIVLAYGEN